MSNEQKLLAACVDYRAKLDKLEAENADRDLTLATIQDIVDDSYRSDRDKVLTIKYVLSK